MKFRPKKKIIEHGLDNLVLGIVLEPSDDRLDYFKVVLDKLQEIGYNVKKYAKIYEEIRQDYKKSKENWRNGFKK